MLAHLLERHPCELRADFQETYGLNLDGMGRDYSLSHAACLAAQLPQKSRCFVAEDPANAWGQGEYLLAAIEYWAHVAVWKDTKDARHKRKPPFEPASPPKREKPKPPKGAMERVKRALKANQAKEA